MPSKGGAKGKKVVKTAAKPAKDDNAGLFSANKRSFGIGGDIPGKRDLGRFVKWPKYVRLQRQKAVLYKRLKVPPSIAQFTNTLDKSTAAELFRVMDKYRPEDKKTKVQRLKDTAAAKVDGKDDKKAGPRPLVVKYGINHITALIEKKKAQLVVIAHDVDPIEIVIFLPALCRKMDIPYCIVKSKSRLGTVVHKKTATAVAITDVRKEDQAAFNKLREAIKHNFNDRFTEVNRKWGGGIMGAKTVHKVKMYAKAKAKELAARQG